MTTTPTSQQVLAVRMARNDSGANTIRDYLVALLTELWREGELFSGKRPFGHTGWQYDLYRPLVSIGYIGGKFDEDGDLEDVDEEAGDRLIAAAILALGRPVPDA